MDKCFEDVKKFMLIGQPELVSTYLRAPGVSTYLRAPGVGAGELFDEHDARSLAAHLRNASKDVRGLTDASPPHRTRFGLGLILKEVGEVLQAAEKGDHLEFADGLVDLIYATVWTAIAHGIDLPAVWDEVQRANMAKFPECEGCNGTGCAPSTPRTLVGRVDNTCQACSGRGRVALRDGSGKVQKPADWTPPDVKRALRRKLDRERAAEQERCVEDEFIHLRK